jgi:hypothetical protein
MAQPLSTVINVSITRQTQFIPRFAFNIANLVGNNYIISPNKRINFYNNLAGVAEDFATTTQEYIAANVYFGQNPGPTGLYISRWVDTAIAEIRTGGRYLGIISTWATVTNGSFRISINGTAANVIALNFSGVTNLLDVAAVIQAGLVTAGFTLATCTFNAILSLFVIDSGTTAGPSSTITYLSTATASVGTDISGAAAGPIYYLDGAVGSSSDVIQGMSAESIPDALNAITNVNNAWYGLLFTNIVRDDANVIAAATWAEGQGEMPKLYFTATNDPNTYNSGDNTSVSYQLLNLQVSHTSAIYDFVVTEYPDAAFMSKDFSFSPGTYTDKFKSLALITPNDQLSQNQVSIIKNKHCNLYCTVGSAPITQEGVVFVGITQYGEYIDVIRFVDWLQNAIAVEVFNLLYSENKVPYTDAGVAMLIQAVTGPLIEGERLGGIAAQIDTNGNLEPAYIVYSVPSRVSEVTSSQRAARISPTITFGAILAGAIHFVNVSGTVTV